MASSSEQFSRDLIDKGRLLFYLICCGSRCFALSWLSANWRTLSGRRHTPQCWEINQDLYQDWEEIQNNTATRKCTENGFRVNMNVSWYKSEEEADSDLERTKINLADRQIPLHFPP
jgi:hypothetical protein